MVFVRSDEAAPVLPGLRSVFSSSAIAAATYKRRGYAPVPIALGTKQPPFKSWQNFDPAPEELLEHFETTGVGLILGDRSGGLVDLDLDSPESVALADAFGLKSGMEHGSPNKPRSHRWFKVDTSTGITQFKDPDGKMLAEVRGNGGQTVVEPTPYPAGGNYAWDSFHEPAELPTAELLDRATRLAIASLLARHWPEQGSRHSAALAAGGFLLRVYDVETAAHLVGQAAKAADDEEWQAREADVRSTADKLAHGEAVTGAPTLGEICGNKVVAKIRKWADVPKDSEAKKGESSESGQSKAQQLIAIGERAYLFHDDRDNSWAAVTDGKGVKRLLRLSGRDFARWLARQLYLETGEAAASETVRSALAVLEAKALFESSEHRLYNRWAVTDEDSLLIDMSDGTGRAIRVTRDGWDIIPAPIVFRPLPHHRPLPEPDRNGALTDILRFIRLQPGQEVLLLPWMVAAVLEDRPRPIVIFSGSHGSGKTSAARRIKEVLDPSATDTLNLNRSGVEQVAQIFDQNAVILLDNLGELTPWHADLACKVVTGDSHQKRRLYSDEDTVLWSYRRALIMTGINLPTAAPDVLDRSLLIGLERVPENERKEESEIRRAFDLALPGILGGLLNTLVETLRIYRDLNLPQLPRMADFARIGAGAAEVLGYGANSFLSAIEDNKQRTTREALDHPVVHALNAFVQLRPVWQGSPSELYKVLTEKHGQVRYGDRWPRNESLMSKELRKLQPDLADMKIFLDFPTGHREGRVIKINAADRSQGADIGDANGTTGDMG